MLGLQAVPGGARTGGRSRFSKALPAVPVADLDILIPPPLPMDVHQSRPRTASPSALRAHDDNKSVKSIARKPVGTSWSSSSKPGTPLPDAPNSDFALPPLPSSSMASMAIPRRPVGATLQPPVPRALVVPPEPSPTDSICSLLSAYSREPDALPTGSTYTTMSTATSPRGSETLSPALKDSSSLRSQAYPLASEAVPQTRVAPVLPPKEGNDMSLPSFAPLPLALSMQEDAILSSRPEIWKRRPNTGDKNKDLPDLKLNYSHGSTASVSSIQTAVIQAAQETVSEQHEPAAEKEMRVPDSLSLGLPGPNIRPSAQDGDYEAILKAMDTDTSSLSPGLGDFHAAKPSPEATAFPPRTDSKRPPTPEYRMGDIEPPPPASVDTGAKPASPISATGSPKEGTQSDTPHANPQSTRAEATARRPPFSSIAYDTSSAPKLPSAAPDLRLATSYSELRRRGPGSPAEIMSPCSAKADSVGHLRTASVSPESAQKAMSPLLPNGLGLSVGLPRRPGTATDGSDPRIAWSEAQGSLYRGRDGTLYAEMKLTGDADPKAAYFPLQSDKVISPGTIISSKPVNQSHFGCFQKHKVMNRRSNRNYPLTCQTCDRADVEDRWACGFCHLRVCEACFRSLNGHQRNLRALVDQLSMGTPLSLSSSSRPGSALGIELPS